MNEDEIRRYAALRHPGAFDSHTHVTLALLQLDELRAIRKLLEPETRIEVATPQPEASAHPLRAEWDSMLPHQRAHFASFDAYAQMHEELEASDDEPLRVKRIAAEHLTPYQIANAMGQHEGKHAIQWCDLTTAQKALP